MKIHFIDKTKKRLKLVSEIEKLGFNNIEIKNTNSFRTAKTDYVILSEYDKNDLENEMLSKHSNLIIITKDINKEEINEFIGKYKVIDIIAGKSTDEYIAGRIVKLIS